MYVTSEGVHYILIAGLILGCLIMCFIYVTYLKIPRMMVTLFMALEGLCNYI